MALLKMVPEINVVHGREGYHEILRFNRGRLIKNKLLFTFTLVISVLISSWHDAGPLLRRDFKRELPREGGQVRRAPDPTRPDPVHFQHPRNQHNFTGCIFLRPH